jgi:hypothetical protein
VSTGTLRDHFEAVKNVFSMALAITGLPWYVYIAGVALLLSLAVLLRAILNKFPGNRPPIYEEIPFIGGLVGFIKSPIELASRGYRAVGEVLVPLAPIRRHGDRRQRLPH